MEHQFLGQPDFTMTRITMAPGEEVVSEAGAMAGMSSNVSIETGMRGGFLESAKRTVMGGESFFVNTFRAEEGQEGVLDLAPGAPGDMFHLDLDGGLGIQRGCFVASDADVDLDASFEGFSGFFSGMGLTMLRARGQGDLFLSSYGALRTKKVTDEYVVDTGHIVAFEESLEYNVERVGGWGTTFFSEEGLVCRFYGEGTVYIQSRNVPSFASWIHPFRPTKND